MKTAECAVAIFARTPGRSAPKTRLASQIGAAAAMRIYGFALNCAAQLGRQLGVQGCEVCWAVAEKGGEKDPCWARTGLPAIHSGEGGLGERLDHVYRFLRERAAVAVLIGSDTPQLDADLVLECAGKARAGFAAGPAEDGGFYIFAGSRPVQDEVWTGVEYSCADTLTRLLDALAEPVFIMPGQTDFDDAKSLRSLLDGHRTRRGAQWLRFAQTAELCLAEHAAGRQA